MYSFIHNEVAGSGGQWSVVSPPTPRSESARGCMERGVKGKKKRVKWTQDVGNRHRSKRGQTGQH